MFADFLIALLSIGFLILFVFFIFNIKRMKFEKKIIEQKRKERNKRFATFDKHFEGKDFFVKEAPFDNDIFASREEEI